MGLVNKLRSSRTVRNTAAALSLVGLLSGCTQTPRGSGSAQNTDADVVYQTETQEEDTQGSSELPAQSIIDLEQELDAPKIDYDQPVEEISEPEETPTQEPPLLHCFGDADNDGQGDKSKPIWVYEWQCPEGSVKNSYDCDDRPDGANGIPGDLDDGANRFTGNEEICDGVDNDCSGFIDEPFYEQGLGDFCAQSTGACYAEGEYVCNDAHDGIICSAVPYDALPEICDLIDNDCDGLTDEQEDFQEYLDALGTCNFGCEDDVYKCVDGLVFCSAPFPQTELCNNYDDDCDGEVDEDFDLGGICYSGVGECIDDGIIACLPDGSGTYCNAVPKEPQTEICDGLDNDCDFEIDEYEDVIKQIESLETVCETVCGPGDYICAGGQIACDAPEPIDELCNGIDDDCDGTIDNGYNIGAGCSLGLGICEDPGVMVCHENELTTYCDSTPGDPGLEICDGYDNDCDGYVDELEDVQLELDALGKCYTPCGEGEYICFGGIIACDAPEENLETCEGTDQDCDGLIDEPYVQMGLGQPCSIGIGACEGTGEFVCTEDELGIMCNAIEGEPTEEVCANLIDDDCDGEIDEGCCDETQPIQDIVPCNKLLLYFKIDNTGSMDAAISDAEQLADDIGALVFSSINDVLFGLGTFKDLESENKEYGILSYEAWKGQVKNIITSGGGDTPESSLYALNNMLGVDWVATTGLDPEEKLSVYTIHMTDANWHKQGDDSPYSQDLTIMGVAFGYIAEGINYIGVHFPNNPNSEFDMLEFISYFPASSDPHANAYLFENYASGTTLGAIISNSILENEPLSSWTECIGGKMVEMTGECEE